MSHYWADGVNKKVDEKFKKINEAKRERGSKARATCRLNYEFLSDCQKWMESEDGCLHCDHHGYPNEFD